MTRRVLAVRLDNAGDVLVTGPAVRAIAASAEVVLLAGPQGADAGRLLPGVAEVMTWACPWVVGDPGRVVADDVLDVVERIRSLDVDEAVVFTSYSQSPLPTALLLRLAGVPRVSGLSADYPGSLLDVRHRVDESRHVPEAERALGIAAAAGFRLPADDGGRLLLAGPLPDVSGLVPAAPYVVVHPGASVPARSAPPELLAQAVAELALAGRRVVVTGGPAERALTEAVAGDFAVDLGGRTSFAEAAAVVAGADCLVVGNTGPAHVAAATGTPVVSLFAPTVPAARWAPYAVPHVLLGDGDAPCAGTRARVCPVPGHPCLASITPQDIVTAVECLAGGAQPGERVQPVQGALA